MKISPRAYRSVTIAALLYMVCWGAILALFPLKPFWRDEWCMLANIKFKSASELWGPLDFTQQFPRVYLQIVKAITSAFNYSYASVRFQSFIVGAAAIALTWHIARRIFEDKPERYLFVLVIAGNPMFIDYMGQVKHYEMEMLMGLVAIWQLLEALHLRSASPGRVVLLFASFIVAPFFSYTYPIAVAPALALLCFSALAGGGIPTQRRILTLSLVAVSTLAIAIFYLLDAAQVMRDSNMHNFWFFKPDYINGGFQKRTTNTWLFFAKTGAGAVFEYVFGIATVAATIAAIWHLAKRSSWLQDTRKTLLVYSLLLIAGLIALYFLDKIPLGQAKFTIFAAPALSLVLATAIGRWVDSNGKRAPRVITAILFAAMAGNILTAFLQLFTSDDYRLKLEIYRANTKALEVARQEHFPIIVTPEIGRPDDITVPVPYLSMPDAAGILKTYPAYHEKDSIAIIPIKRDPAPADVIAALPPNTVKYILSNGKEIKIMDTRH